MTTKENYTPQVYDVGHVCSDNLGICPQCLEHCEFEKES
jgi:hypothetical protein